jgi:hypothetical protein
MFSALAAWLIDPCSTTLQKYFSLFRSTYALPFIIFAPQVSHRKAALTNTPRQYSTAIIESIGIATMTETVLVMKFN